MPSSKAARRLQDIVEDAEAIFRYTDGMDVEAFENDRLICDAMERCRERICEAMVKLGQEADVLLPGQPWQQFKSFGNLLRHGYDLVQEARVFEIVRDDLPSLHAAALAALRKQTT